MTIDSDHWCTPDTFLGPMRHFNGGRPPAFDPCSNPNSIVGADIEFYGPPHGQDGLVVNWPIGLLTFVNPPHSEKPIWMRKCHEQAARGAHIIALVPAYTDTRWFHEFNVRADCNLFWKGRLTFGGDQAFPARFPSLATYWGPRIQYFRETLGKYGLCI